MRLFLFVMELLQLLKDIADSYDYLMSYDNIVICFDNDEAGKESCYKSRRDVIS